MSRETINVPRSGLKHIPLVFALIFTLLLLNGYGLTRVINTEFQVLVWTASFFMMLSVVVYFLSWVRGHNPHREDVTYPRRYTIFRSLEYLNKDLLLDPKVEKIDYAAEELDRLRKVVKPKPEAK